MIMIGLIKDKIKQTEIERKSMSKNHRENFNKTKKKRIELHRNKTKKRCSKSCKKNYLDTFEYSNPIGWKISKVSFSF